MKFVRVATEKIYQFVVMVQLESGGVIIVAAAAVMLIVRQNNAIPSTYQA